MYLFRPRCAAKAGSMSSSMALNILGLQAGATRDAVREAFRQKAMRWHPDLNASPEAQARFLECRAAFEMLLTSPGHINRPSGATDNYRWNVHQEKSGKESTMRNWQKMEERRKQMFEQIRKDAAKAAKEANMKAVGFRLSPGVLLVAGPERMGFFHMRVVLVIEIDESFARGIVVNGGPGGLDAPFEHTVFHSCEQLSHLRFTQIVMPGVLYATEPQSENDVSMLRKNLEARGELSAITKGYTWWRLEQVVADLERGDWAVWQWEAKDVRWWLTRRHQHSMRSLWMVARTKLSRQNQ